MAGLVLTVMIQFAYRPVSMDSVLRLILVNALKVGKDKFAVLVSAKNVFTGYVFPLKIVNASTATKLMTAPCLSAILHVYMVKQQVLLQKLLNLINVTVKLAGLGPSVMCLTARKDVASATVWMDKFVNATLDTTPLI